MRRRRRRGGHAIIAIGAHICLIATSYFAGEATKVSDFSDDAAALTPFDQAPAVREPNGCPPWINNRRLYAWSSQRTFIQRRSKLEW